MGLSILASGTRLVKIFWLLGYFRLISDFDILFLKSISDFVYWDRAEDGFSDSF